MFAACKPQIRLPDSIPFPPEQEPGLSYTNIQDPEVPISIHVARVDRQQADLVLRILHSQPLVCDVTNMSNMIAGLPDSMGRPLVAINGDYFDRDRPYAGDPRGIEILNGEVTSAPGAYVSLVLDAGGQPSALTVTSLFQVTWPDGAVTPAGLNERRKTNSLVLYAPSFGPSTGTRSNGFEMVLETPDGSPWPALRIGREYTARIVEITDTNTPVSQTRMVLSAGPNLAPPLPRAQTGAVVRISTRTAPDLSAMAAGIGGGPVLVRDGRALRIRTPTKAEAPTKWAKRVPFERHPRTAFGWNDRYYFLVEVDGRQTLNKLSEGMTLAELARCMVQLGCRQAVNLDGGGSSTFWLQGSTVSSPCDRREREIANAMVVFRRPPAVTATRAPMN